MPDVDAEDLGAPRVFRPLAAILPPVLNALEALARDGRLCRSLGPDAAHLAADCRWALEVLGEAVALLRDRANPNEYYDPRAPTMVERVAAWTAEALAAGDDWDPGRDVERLEAWREILGRRPAPAPGLPPDELRRYLQALDDPEAPEETREILPGMLARLDDEHPAAAGPHGPKPPPSPAAPGSTNPSGPADDDPGAPPPPAAVHAGTDAQPEAANEHPPSVPHEPKPGTDPDPYQQVIESMRKRRKPATTRARLLECMRVRNEIDFLTAAAEVHEDENASDDAITQNVKRANEDMEAKGLPRRLAIGNGRIYWENRPR